MSQIVDTVAQRVRDRLRSAYSDPTLARTAARDVAHAEVRRHNDYALARGADLIDDESPFVDQVLAEVTGFGALQPYLDDPEIEEVWLNAPDRVFVARQGVSTRVPVELDERQVRDLVERMLHATGRRIDLSQPFVDAALPDGSRLHVVLGGIARGSWAVNIRKFMPSVRTLADLVRQRSMPSDLADTLGQAVTDGASILVSGATHAGKTTMLAALIGASPPGHRIVTVEETFELGIDAPDVVALQGRQPSLEGTGEITLRRLVKETLRMRPDRLVVGEVRDAEALDLILALNTGIPGAATIHANSATDALSKLASLTLLAGRNIDRSFVVPAIATSVQLVVHCHKRPDGLREVREVIETTGAVENDAPVTRTLYRAPRVTGGGAS